MITYFVQQPGIYVAYGLSTDTKPTSPPVNCLFIEIDTGQRYIVTASEWVAANTGSELILSDSTDNNATTEQHGFLPKLSGNATDVLNGVGDFVAHNHDSAYEAKNANIQTHVASAHAPSNATANSADAALLARANHTGTQAQSTITNLVTDLSSKASASHSHTTGEVTGLDAALSGKAPTSHSHAITDTTNLQSTLDAKALSTHNHDAAYEAKNTNIQAHVGSAHAPSTAQKNSDILQVEIEAKLTGVISSHSHAGSGGAAITSVLVDTGVIPSAVKTAVVTDAAITTSSKIIVGWGNVLETDENSPEMDDVSFMTVPADGSFTLKVSSVTRHFIRGFFRINYLTSG